MTAPTAPITDPETHVPILVSGIPHDLLRWFDLEAFRLAHGKRAGGRSGKGKGRSGLIVRAMALYRDGLKREALARRWARDEKEQEQEGKGEPK